MTIEKLFTPLTLGGKQGQALELLHRVVMAPLTRLRAGDLSIQPQSAAEYYSQRATKGGLLIAEATDISPTAHGYYGAPGVYNEEQIKAWKAVTEAVHAKGGMIFLQIWHTGRVSHPLNQPNGEIPVSSSASLPSNSGKTAYTKEGRVPFVTPRALELEEIPNIVKDFQQAALNAKIAGFDGVEIHGANGYLIEQFLSDGVNQRKDEYGGSIENRVRFLFEIIQAVIKIWNSAHVGLRLSPFGVSFGSTDSNPTELYSFILQKLNAFDLAYVHLIEPRGYHFLNENAPKESVTNFFRPFYQGVLMTASGYDRASGIQVVKEKTADLVAYGRDFISNPDLVERLKQNAKLTPYDTTTFYGGNEKGYTDYPFMHQ
jgi:2,4-dienoyl-CoA reductase-like NADH-dependent reductase (Old Yellow Enzyme family)